MLKVIYQMTQWIIRKFLGHIFEYIHLWKNDKLLIINTHDFLLIRTLNLENRFSKHKVLKVLLLHKHLYQHNLLKISTLCWLDYHPIWIFLMCQRISLLSYPCMSPTIVTGSSKYSKFGSASFYSTKKSYGIYNYRSYILFFNLTIHKKMFIKSIPMY